MRLYTTLIFLFLIISSSVAQNTRVSGTVLNAANDLPLENVNLVNLNQVKGTTTNSDGYFEIVAAVNDTLYFSYLRFKTIQVRVTKEWMKCGEGKVKMTGIGTGLEESVVKPFQLTGYCGIDAKNIPIYENYRYSISGLNSGYAAGEYSPTAA